MINLLIYINDHCISDIKKSQILYMMNTLCAAEWA